MPIFVRAADEKHRREERREMSVQDKLHGQQPPPRRPFTGGRTGYENAQGEVSALWWTNMGI